MKERPHETRRRLFKEALLDWLRDTREQARWLQRSGGNTILIQDNPPQTLVDLSPWKRLRATSQDPDRRSPTSNAVRDGRFQGWQMVWALDRTHPDAVWLGLLLTDHNGEEKYFDLLLPGGERELEKWKWELQRGESHLREWGEICPEGPMMDL